MSTATAGGAATARAFARGLESLLDDAKMPLDATNMLPAGAVVPAGPTLLGIPISIEFMGLLDTVSAVGVPHILPSATGHLGWAANSLRLPTTKGFLKSCYHFVAGHEQHGDLPLDSIRGPDGKYPAGAVEVVYPGMHADVGGDCKPAELGKVQTDARSLLSKIVLHDMYAAAFDAGAPLSVPEEVLPGGAQDKKYRVMQGYVADYFKISEQAIALFNAWQQAGAQQAGRRPKRRPSTRRRWWPSPWLRAGIRSPR
ncbi:phospholipase effector Tle1 domain-containing protein [Klebsiella aerogenes]